MADTKETRLAREKQRQEAGLCKRCGKNRTGGPKLCRICLADANKKTKAMWQRRKDAGLCWNCGRRAPAPKRSWCTNCRAAKDRKRRQRERAGFCNQCLVHPVHGELKTCNGCRATQKRARDKLRDQAFAAYGGYVCVCCGETQPLFLSLDHVDGGGAGHRKLLGGGNVVFADLRRKGFPSGFQVLCRNCNGGKYANGGVCPHRAAA